jgi:nicotinic acid phosphoribosyltransferase
MRNENVENALTRLMEEVDINESMARSILSKLRLDTIQSDPRRMPFLLDTDSYKLGHHKMYPDSKSMTAYFTFRGPLTNDDERIVFFGMRYLFETVISHTVEQFEVDEAAEYLKTHGVGKSEMNWPQHLWQKVVDNGGHIPVRVKSLRDGTVVYPQIPCFTITATTDDFTGDEFAYLVTWLETSMMRLWSPSVTATKSRHVWSVLRSAFDKSVEKEFDFLLPSRLHDFGSRGVSSAETAMTTGAGHLLSFEGTDTMTAGWIATKWNNGEPVGESVMASEHSVMTAWPKEMEAVEHLIGITPSGQILSCVADSYNYSNPDRQSFLWTILPQIAPLAKQQGILFVVRPDSGDPVKCVLDGLKACEAAFGATVNSKGYKVIDGAAVIQGDGIDARILEAITRSVLNAGYSIQNVAFGMGGGLLQRQNRDTLKTAIKLCKIEYSDGTVRDVMKKPSRDIEKTSLPGLTVVNSTGSELKIYPSSSSDWDGYSKEHDMLEVIWDCGPVDYTFETFSEMRVRLNSDWRKRAPTCNVFSTMMKAKLEREAALIEGGSMNAYE